MSKFYELSFEIQIKRLRNTALLSPLVGAYIGYQLFLNHHHFWALIAVVIALQVSLGSAIMRNDIKKDMIYAREEAEKKVKPFRPAHIPAQPA